MTKRAVWFLGALAVAAATTGIGSSGVTGAGARGGVEASSRCNEGKAAHFRLESTVAFTSTRDDPSGIPLLASEIYLMNSDGTNPRRLTDNTAGDGFPELSPDGKKIVFDSNRARAEGEPLNTSDLFLMDADGSEQTLLTRGSSATWSPDCKQIAFHASASGTGTPIRTDPGSATSDSDIFVATVDNLLAGTEAPRNITNSETMIEDDPDWSPDGQKIVFTAHPVDDAANPSNRAELYLTSPDGSGLRRLTANGEEERAPAWSPDGTRMRTAAGSGAARIRFVSAS